MSGRYYSREALARMAGKGCTAIGEPVPGVEEVDNYAYHPPTADEDEDGYK